MTSMHTKRSLPSTVVPNWPAFRKAYEFRHVLVHGASGTIGVTYASQAVEAILAVSKALVQYSENHNAPIYGRRIVRRMPRQVSRTAKQGG